MNDDVTICEPRPERRARLATLGLAIAIPALVVVPAGDAGALAAVKLATLAALACAAAWASRHDRTLTAVEMALGAFAMLVMASVVVHPGAWPAAVPNVAGAIALLLVVRATRVREVESRELESALVLAVAVVAAFALAELLGVTWSWTRERRPGGTFGNRNFLAGWLVIALPFVVARSLRGSRRASWVLALAALVVTSTRCRSAYLGAAGGLLIALAFARRPAHRPARRELAWTAGAALVGILGALLPWPGISFRVSVGAAAARLLDHEGASGLGRLGQHRIGWAALTSAWHRIPTGFGAGSWEAVSARWKPILGGVTPGVLGATTPSSDALRVLVEAGIVGAAALALAIVCTVRAIVRSSPNSAAASPALGASLTAAFLHGVFDAPLYRAETLALIAVVVGVSQGRRSALSVGWWLGKVCSAVAVVAALACILRASSFLLSRGDGGELQSADSDRLQRRALAVFPRPDLLQSVALTDAHAGRCDDAYAGHVRLLAISPSHWAVPSAVAICFARFDRGVEARQVWRKALGCEPELGRLVAGMARTAEERSAVAWLLAAPQ